MAFQMSHGSKMGGRTCRRWGASRRGRTDSSQSAPSRLTPVCREQEGLTRPLGTISSLLPTFWTPTQIHPRRASPPFLLVSKPLASDSLTIPGSFPAHISTTTAATVSVVWKSFSRIARPYRKNSWFRKIKFCYSEQGSSLRHSGNRTGICSAIFAV